MPLLWVGIIGLPMPGRQTCFKKLSAGLRSDDCFGKKITCNFVHICVWQKTNGCGYSCVPNYMSHIFATWKPVDSCLHTRTWPGLNAPAKFLNMTLKQQLNANLISICAHSWTNRISVIFELVDGWIAHFTTNTTQKKYSRSSAWEMSASKAVPSQTTKGITWHYEVISP